jgi:hypothetical protein
LIILIILGEECKLWSVFLETRKNFLSYKLDYSETARTNASGSGTRIRLEKLQLYIDTVLVV